MELKICTDAITTFGGFIFCEVKFNNLCFDCYKSKIQLSLILDCSKEQSFADVLQNRCS